MCNDYEQHVAYAEYCAAMQAENLGIPTNQGEADLPRYDDIKVNQIAPVMRASGNVVELAAMNWSWRIKPGGKPVFNFRSEGRRFENSKRCLIPASAFFEFTGTTYPKTKHRFTLNDAPFMAIAGVYRDGETGKVPNFTMLTTEPGPDVAPYHDRQVVVLRPALWASWLYLDRPEAELLRSLPARALTVETLDEERGRVKI